MKKFTFKRKVTQTTDTVTVETHTDNLTELVFILDRSGSMGGLESDTIGGFNSMLEKQRKQEGMAYVSTILFDHETEVLHDRLPIDKVKPLTNHDYTVRGCTALLDAIGGAIHHIGNVHKYARPEDVPQTTMFVIITDGMENASKRYNGREIKAMIEKEKAKYGWEFLFIGANIDAIATAKTFGISEDKAVNYHADRQGTQVVYETMSNAVSCARAGMPLAPSWNKAIEDDYNARKRSR